MRQFSGFPILTSQHTTTIVLDQLNFSPGADQYCIHVFVVGEAVLSYCAEELVALSDVQGGAH